MNDKNRILTKQYTFFSKQNKVENMGKWIFQYQIKSQNIVAKNRKVKDNTIKRKIFPLLLCYCVFN